MAVTPALPFPLAETERPLPERFRRVAAHFADRLAVKAGAQTYTFRQLDALSDHLAGALAPALSAPGQPVGLLLGSAEAAPVLAGLGVLKANGAYLGLPPAAPLERNRALWAEAGAACLLADAAHADQARAIAPGAVLVLEDQLAAPARPLPALTVAPDQLAALFYTSGSTGRPKGVQRTQLQFMHRAWLNAHDLGCQPDDRATLSHFIGFAASAASIFSTLLNGGAVFPMDSHAYTINQLLAFLEREAITMYGPPVTLFRQILGELSAPLHLPHLRLIGLGGEALRPDDVRAFRRFFPPTCRLAYRLSMSETGVVCQRFFDPDTPLPPDRLNVGLPVEACQVLIWDDQHRPVPAGVIGHIVIRSRFLPPGYWRNEELTRRTFLPDPEGGDRRLFVTADLGRLLPDGALEHLGRDDQMVKVRGYRVELGEVELAVQQCAPEQPAVVLARPTATDEVELVAYLVVAPAAEFSIPALRRALAARLPDYMVPARFVRLDRWPLTTTGKVDRQALLALPLPPTALDDSYVAPRDDLERQLTALWEAVLHTQPIGRHADFFDLGGNSLAAIAVLARLAKTTGHTLPLTALFQAPTIAQLTAVLRGDSPAAATPTAIVSLQPMGRRAPLFLVPELETSAINLMKLIRFLGVQQPIYGLHPQGFDDGLKPHTTIEAAARYYVDAVRAVQPTGPYLLAGMCHGALVAFEMAQQLRAQGQAVTELFLIDVAHLSPAAVAAPERAQRWIRRQVRLLKNWKNDTRDQYAPMLREWLAPNQPGPDNTWRPTRQLRAVQRRAYSAYRAHPYPGAVSALLSAQNQRRDVLSGWRRVLSDSLESEVVPDVTHIQLLREERYLRVLAEWLVGRLDRLDLAAPPRAAAP